MDLIAVVFCGHETMLSLAEKDIYQLLCSSHYVHTNFDTKFNHRWYSTSVLYHLWLNLASKQHKRKAKKQADLKSTIQWNKPFREAGLGCAYERVRHCLEALTFGGPGQSAPAAHHPPPPPSVGSTDCACASLASQTQSTPVRITFEKWSTLGLACKTMPVLDYPAHWCLMIYSCHFHSRTELCTNVLLPAKLFKWALDGLCWIPEPSDLCAYLALYT